MLLLLLLLHLRLVLHTGRVPKVHCWIIIEADAFSAAEQVQFEKIASYLIGYDKITPDEMDKLSASILKTSNKSAVTNGNGGGGDGKDSGTKPKATKSTTADGAGAGAVGGAEAGPSSKPTCIIQYPMNVTGAHSIRLRSYEYLAVGEYVDDAILDFYTEFLRLEVLSPEQRDRSHFFSVFFYSILTARPSRGRFTTPGQTAAQKRHERVAKWTKDVNIFEKDFVFVPINSRNHWFLAVICFPSLDAPVYMETNEPVPPKKRRSASKCDDPKPIKQ